MSQPEPSAHSYDTWTAVWRGGLATDVSARQHTLRVDEPPEFGGGDTGPMPTEMLAIGLASCMCLAIAWAARKKRVEIADLEVDVTPHRAPGEPRHGRYEVLVRCPVPAERLRPVVELASRYCWVSNTLRTPPEIFYRVAGD